MNEQAQEDLKALYQQYTGKQPDKVVFLTQAGSDRQYFRLYGERDTLVGTYSPNPEETAAFINFTGHFRKKGLPVPEVVAQATDKHIYIQQDLGDTSLFSLLQQPEAVEKNKRLLQDALSKLAELQVKGDEGFDYDWTYSGRAFDHYGMVSDLNYWKYYFLRPLNITYDGYALDRDFDTLATWLEKSPHQYFMFRDFQSRNIMVKDRQLWFIDYQGGRKGPALYDCASFLWQARSGISYELKDELAEGYLDALEKDTGSPLNREEARQYYTGFVLLRLLQVLGAYGYRGLFERKAHFVASIPLALDNIAWWLGHCSLPLELEELNKVLKSCISEEIVQKFSATRKDTPTRLTVTIHSFSYKKELPTDTTGNGGGFMFDCRFIDNPGRKEEYKALTGLDEPVKNYLATTAMPAFLEQVFGIVDRAVENYMERDFEHLTVSFGCTGGQHRSVFAAEALAQHMRQRFPVQVVVRHIEQEKKNAKP